jgi:hypothetical protein
LHKLSCQVLPTNSKQITSWLETVDPGAHRRIKGLRLVTAYGIAAMLGNLLQRSYLLPDGPDLGYLSAGFALWASVSEGRGTRSASTCDLAILNSTAAVGAMLYAVLAPISIHHVKLSPEWILISGAFLVGYLRRFGTLGAGVGSQIYIGQLLAYGLALTRADLGIIALAGLIAAMASIVPRVLSGPAEHPALSPDRASSVPMRSRIVSRELRMGLQTAVAALVVVLLSGVIHLRQSAWAITASTYVIAGSAAGTADRVRRRIIGTSIGVPLGILCVPISVHLPPLAWMLAAIAMIIYAMALPERYDIACAAYAFTLMVTLAISGETSFVVLVARAWETLIGGALGVIVAKSILPLPELARASVTHATVDVSTNH